MLLIKRIIKLRNNFALSKHEQLVHGVIGAIEKDELTIGDKLPSINVMVREVGYARKTIVKAYEELKDRGLIESKQFNGYFVSSQETNTTLKVALLMFAFQNFQEEFYNCFRKELGKRFRIDVFFHHNNISIFETIMSNITGRYGMYVVAPIPNPEIVPILKRIPFQKLLIVDRYLFLGKTYSYISQEFENATFSKLEELLPSIKAYNKFVLFFNKEADYTPIGILRAFEMFVLKHNLNASVKKKYVDGSIEKGNLYLIVSDSILWHVLKDSVQKKFVIGKDVGILSHNDDVSKEIAFGGITTFSTDFKEMGKLAANHIKHSKKTQVIMPFELIKRNSL